MKILQAIVNYSITYSEPIFNCFKHDKLCLMDVHSDSDYNRMVVTVLGDPETLIDCLFHSVKRASELIDLRNHEGVHPFIGATDVIPLVPLEDISISEAIDYANKLAKRVSELGIPVFLYEKAKDNRKLPAIRKGGLRGLKERLANNEIMLDYGTRLHESAGASVIGVRDPLIAYNVTLDSQDLSLARQIARQIRESNGGLEALSAIGVYCQTLGKVQVSCNLRDYKITSLDDVFNEIERLSDNILSSEIIGCVFRDSISNPDRLKLTRFDEDMIIESWVSRYKQRVEP